MTKLEYLKYLLHKAYSKEKYYYALYLSWKHKRLEIEMTIKKKEKIEMALDT